METIDVLMLGTRTGNFHPNAYSEPRDFAAFVAGCFLRRRNGTKRLIAPRCNFTATVLDARELSLHLNDHVAFVRPDGFADGAIVHDPESAIVLFTADCLTVAILDQGSSRLAGLHVGFRSLFRADGSPQETTILEILFRNHGFPAKEVEVWGGGGIGACCFGIDHYPEASGVEYGVATQGPRKGQRSVDLRRVVKNRLLTLGVPEAAIKLNATCTACCTFLTGGGASEPTYHSHSREEGRGGRNAILVAFGKARD